MSRLIGAAEAINMNGIVAPLPYTSTEGKLSLPSRAALDASALLWCTNTNKSTIAFSGELYSTQPPTEVPVRSYLQDEWRVLEDRITTLPPGDSTPAQIAHCLDLKKEREEPLLILAHECHIPRVLRTIKAAGGLAARVCVANVTDILNIELARELEVNKILPAVNSFNRANEPYERLPRLATSMLAPFGLPTLVRGFNALTKLMGKNSVNVTELPNGEFEYTQTRVR